MNYPCGGSTARSGDVDIPPSCERVIGRGHHGGGKRLNLLYQGTHFCLSARVLLDQAFQPVFHTTVCSARACSEPVKAS